MDTFPPYLRVGPVAIHLHSRETSHKSTSHPSGFSFAGPTLDVQGSVMLSPDDGTSIQELNELAPSNGSSPPLSTVPSPASSLPPFPSPAASTPLVISSVSNAEYQSSPSNPAPIPPSSPSIQQPNVQKTLSPGSQVIPTPTPLPTSLPQTKGSTSSPGPTPSPSPGTSSQPSVLAGSRTTVLPDPSFTELVGPISSTSLEAASPTIAPNNYATNKNTTPIIAGSILAAILGVVLVVAVITWFLRVRSRRRPEDEFSWDPEPNTGHGYNNSGFFGSPSPFQAGQDRVVPPIRLQPPDPTPGSQSDFEGPRAMSFSTHLATPELAHIPGPLTVTNLMPGDVPLSTNTSVFMGSRPGSAQVTPRVDNSAPRFMRLPDGGLPVPWARSTLESNKGSSSRPKLWPSRLSAASLKNVFSPSAPKPTQVNSPQPRTSTANMRTYFKLASNSDVQLPEPARTTDQTWSGTIRTGITSAWSAVMGTSARPHEPSDRNLTPIPPRINRRLTSKTGSSTLDSMSATSTQFAASHIMEEKSKDHPIARGYSYGLSHTTSSLDETIREEVEGGGGTDDWLPSPNSSAFREVPAQADILEETSVPPIPGLPGDPVGRPSSLPRLPTIRPLSRAWTLKSEAGITLPESDDGYRNAFNQMINERKQEYTRRFTELEAVATEETSRPVMSRASTTSLMTESTALSRESSVMDDDERRAKNVLKMRRKRAMALSASSSGNAKASGS